MRGWLFVAFMVTATSCAYAADMPDFLRGGISDVRTTRTNWAGPYVGAQVTYGSADMDFGQSSQDLIARLLNHTTFEVNKDESGDASKDTRISRWRFLNDTTQQSAGVGGYIGYNYQFDDAVVGLELNYTHGKFSGQSFGSKGQFDSTSTPGYITQLDAFGTASMTVRDFGSARLRGGWAVGDILPYGFVGVALGQADISRSVGININYVPATVPATVPAIPGFSQSLSDNRHAQFIYGWAAGLGFDYMLCAGLYVRGEWEYLRFTSAVDTTINTVRAGVGYKF